MSGQTGSYLSLYALSSAVTASFQCTSFLSLQALQNGTGGSSLAARLEVLSNSVTQSVMAHVGQVLFNADRLACGMHMARSLAPHLFQPQDWDLFLGNSLGTAHHCVAVTQPV